MCLCHLSGVSFSCQCCGLMRMFMGFPLSNVCLSARACLSSSQAPGVRVFGGGGGDDDGDGVVDDVEDGGGDGGDDDAV